MVTEVGAAISDWDRDGRMWWLALAGKTLPDGRTLRVCLCLCTCARARNYVT